MNHRSEMIQPDTIMAVELIPIPAFHVDKPLPRQSSSSGLSPGHTFHHRGFFSRISHITQIGLKSNPNEPGSDFENVLEPFRPHSRLEVCPWEDELEKHLGILSTSSRVLGIWGSLDTNGIKWGHNSIYAGEITPVAHFFSAIYRGYPCHSIYNDRLGAHGKQCSP